MSFNPIADNPTCWSWPEDVRERMAARRREIDAVREQAAEETERVGTIWSDWLRKMREQPKDDPPTYDFYGV